MSKCGQRVYDLLETLPAPHRGARAVRLSLLIIILINIFAMVLETVPSIHVRAPRLFQVIEVVSVAIFTVEYLARVWCCTLDPALRHPVTGRLRHAIQPLALIDLAAILPFYLPMLALDLRFARALRLFRLARIGKLGRHVAALQLCLGGVVRSRKEELAITAALMLVLLLFTAAGMYYVEHEVQPEVFSSIPASMWWAVVTITTVGYGDALPVTPLGKSLAAVVAMLGIGMFALPTGVLGAAFVEQLQDRQRGPTMCPHCGKTIEGTEESPEGAAAP